MIDSLRQLELLHNLSSKIELDERRLTKGNRTIRSLLEDQLNILSGKNNKNGKNGNSQILIEEIKIKIKIHQVELDEISRNLGYNKNKQEQVLATSLESLRELLDSDFQKTINSSQSGKELLVLLDVAISSLERIGQVLGGDWLFRIQLVRKLFHEKMERSHWPDNENIESFRDWGTKTFSQFKRYILKVKDEVEAISGSLSVIPNQRFGISLEDLTIWENEIEQKFKDLDSMCKAFAEESPVELEDALDWIDTFIIRYASFTYQSLEENKEEIRDIFDFCQREGDLYNSVAAVFQSRKQLLAELRTQYQTDENGLSKAKDLLFSGHIKEAEKGWNGLSKKFSELDYETINREIGRFGNIRNEIEKAVEQIALTATEPSFFQLTLNKSSVSVEQIEETFQRLLKKIDGLPECDFKDNIRNEVLEHLRYLNSRENVQQESRFVARFALLFLIFGILGYSSYWGYNQFTESKKASEYFIHLDEALSESIAVWVAGNQVEAEILPDTGKVRYGLPSASELVVFKSVEQGDITLDVNMHGAAFLDMTTEVNAILEGKEKSDIQDLLHRSLNDHVSIKKEYEKTITLIEKMEERQKKAQASLDKYYERYPQFREEVRMQFEKESMEKQTLLQKKLDVHRENKKILNRELLVVQEEAVALINQHILDNVMLIPSLGEEAVETIFYTDYTNDSTLASPTRKTGEELVVSRVIQNDPTLSDPTSGRKQQLIYLLNFPAQIMDKGLRSQILRLYEKWHGKKQEFEDKEAILQLRLNQHLETIAEKREEFQKFEAIVDPLVSGIADIERLLPEERSKADLLKNKLEKVGSNVLELKGQIDTSPDSILFN